jgi:hypothetical protein
MTRTPRLAHHLDMRPVVLAVMLAAVVAGGCGFDGDFNGTSYQCGVGGA